MTTQTDRELLEQAAKAAEVSGTWVESLQCLELIEFDNCISHWNPITNDGDALRLSTLLRLSIEHHNDTAQPLPWVRVVDRNGRWTHVGVKDFADNPHAAIRYAIVLAAAQLQGTNHDRP